MSKTKIILASTLSVLAVASVTTAAVVVTQKRKKQSDSPKTRNEGNQVVVAADSKFEYALDDKQKQELTAKLLLVKGQDVTVTLTENNTSKTITTKVKEDGTVDFSSLKDGKTYTVTKIVVKEGENERDLIAEVKAHNEDSGQGKGQDASGSSGSSTGTTDSQPAGGTTDSQPAGGTTDSQPAGGTTDSQPAGGTTDSQGDKTTLKVVKSSWEGYENGNKDKQGYITFTLWSTNEKYDEIVKAGGQIKLLLWFDKFDDQKDGAMPVTLKTTQGDKTVYTSYVTSKDGGKQFQIQTISPFTLSTWGMSQGEVKTKLIGLFINNDESNNLIDGAQGKPVIINK